MKLYIKFLGIHLRSAMQHKAAFFMMMLSQITTSLASLLIVYFLFDRFGQVDGFNFEEVLICYAVVLMAFSLAECFVRGLDVFPRLLGNGQFDRMLVRPRNEVFQVLASTVEFGRIGRVIQALVMMILGGMVMFAALFWIYAGLSFFTTEGLEFMNVFTDGSRDHGAYPVSVYGREALRFYTYVVPLACIQYYPQMYLLGRWTRPWLIICPLAGGGLLLPAWAIWRLGLRHYRSTGS